jgi:integrase
VPLPSERHGEQKFLKVDQVESLAEVIAPRFRAFVLVAAYGGLRWGELAGLRRGRIDLLRGRIEVIETLVEVGSELSFGQPKTRRSRRTVPLPRRIVSELSTHLDRFVGSDSDALAFTGARGNPLRRASFGRHYWQPATTKAGLEGLRVHDLRHTFVSLWVAAGAHPGEISVRAGHSSAAFTWDRYGHLYEDQERDVPDRLEALLASAVSIPDATVKDLRSG